MKKFIIIAEVTGEGPEYETSAKEIAQYLESKSRGYLRCQYREYEVLPPGESGAEIVTLH